MGLLLYIISVVLSALLLVFWVVFGLISSFIQVHFISGIRKADSKFRKLAVAVDMYGNVACEELFNAALIRSASVHRFGTRGETISEVIGWNLLEGTLTRTGKILNNILNIIEADHALKAIHNPIPQ